MTDQISLGDDGKAPPPEDNSNPSQDQLILGKFKSVEDLQQAYLSLEQKLGQQTPPPPKDPTPQQSPQVAELIRNASNEFTAKGELSAETRQALAQAGITDDVVNAVVQGEQIRRTQQTQEIMQAAGGQETYQAVKAWAEENLSDSEIEAFNQTVQSGNVAAAKLAVQGLVARMRGAVPSTPAGKPASGSPRNLTPFRSQHELMEAMNDPRYAAGDPAYHEDLLRRVELSGDLLSRVYLKK